MEVREFAEAITGLCEMFERADEVVNGRKTIAAVRIRSDFKDNSFDFLLELQQILQAMEGLELTFEDLRNVRRVLRMLGMLREHGGLIFLYRWLRGGSPKEVTRQSDGKISIVRDDDESTVVSKEEYELYGDSSVRRAVKKMVGPVEKNDGIDRVEIRSAEDDGNEPVAKIDWREVRYFSDPEDPEKSVTETREVRLHLVTVQLEGSGKWGFRHSKEGHIKAKMLDEGFSMKMEKGERFARGDVIRALLREQKWVGGTKPSEYEVVEVREHLEAHQQHTLPGMGESGDK